MRLFKFVGFTGPDMCILEAFDFDSGLIEEGDLMKLFCYFMWLDLSLVFGLTYGAGLTVKVFGFFLSLSI